MAPSGRRCLLRLAMMTATSRRSPSFSWQGGDYTGFQYLRDNDPDSMGHNTSFLTRIANNVLFVLNDSRCEAEGAGLRPARPDRPLRIQALPADEVFPARSRRRHSGRLLRLNLNAVRKASRELYVLDARSASTVRPLFDILRSMDSTQKAYLDAMKGKGWKSWPDITDEQVRPR